MEDTSHPSDPTRVYDASIVRPELHIDAIRHRREARAPRASRALKRALRKLHTLEMMAVNIYRFQITSEPSELNRHLIAAMCNEMTHLQDFQIKLYEHGWRPSPIRWMFWVVGFVFGILSRMAGRKAILKMGVWVERKAVDHYGELLESVPWDDDTRRIVEKDRADEESHIARWRQLLEGEE